MHAITLGRWSPPASAHCPNRHAVEQRFYTWEHVLEDWHVDAWVDAREGGWALQFQENGEPVISLPFPEGRRSDCDEAVAQMVELVHCNATTICGRLPEEPAESAPMPPAPATDKVRLGWGAQASAIADVGTTTGPAGIGGSMALFLKINTWMLRVRGGYLTEAAEPSELPTVIANLGLGAAELGHQWALTWDGSHPPELGDLSTAMMAGFEGGVMLGRHRVPSSQYAPGPWMALAANLEATLHLGRGVGVYGTVGAAVPLLSTRVCLPCDQASSKPHQPSPIVFRPGLGLSLATSL